MEDKFKVPVANKCIIRSTGEEVEVIAFNLPNQGMRTKADDKVFEQGDPSTVNNIGNYFLYHSSVINLISKAVVPPTIAANTFSEATITNIYVPDAQVNDYKADANWSAYASKIKGFSEFVEP